MKVKVICPECQSVIEIDDAYDIATCHECQKSFQVLDLKKYTAAYIAKLRRNAESYESNAYSFKEAFNVYKEILTFIPNDLDAACGMLINGIKKSSFKDTYFQEFITTFNSLDLTLDSTTYIRLGHFFEQIYTSINYFQLYLVSFLKSCNEKEKEIIYKDLMDLYYLYNLIFENLALFTSEEYHESIFVEKEIMEKSFDDLKKIILNKEAVSYDNDVNKDSVIFHLNGKDIKYSEFNIDDYNDVQDFNIFRVNTSAKNYIYIFVALILCCVLALVGAILSFTVEPKYIGYSILGISIAAFAVIYIIFVVMRKRTLASLNNYSKIK